MYLCQANRTIIEAHFGKPFQLPPTSSPVAPLKDGQNSYAPIDRDRLDVRDCAYDFKSHRVLKITSSALGKRCDLNPDFSTALMPLKEVHLEHLTRDFANSYFFIGT